MKVSAIGLCWSFSEFRWLFAKDALAVHFLHQWGLDSWAIFQLYNSVSDAGSKQTNGHHTKHILRNSISQEVMVANQYDFKKELDIHGRITVNILEFGWMNIAM